MPEALTACQGLRFRSHRARARSLLRARGAAAGERIEPGRAVLAEEGVLDLELEEEELWTDDAAADHEGWFCVSTNPFPCPPRAARSSPST